MPEKVLTGYEPDGIKEFVKQEKLAIRTFLKVDPQTPTLVKALGANWGWSSVALEGHAVAKRHMSNRAQYGLSEYIEIRPRFVGFKSYDEVDCLNHLTQHSSTKGQISLKSPCDHRWEYHLPIDRPDTYMNCDPPYLTDGKPDYFHGCTVSTSLVIRKVGEKLFYLSYRYNEPPDWLASGDWKIVDKRIQEWLTSIDVTDQYLPLGVNK